MLRRVNPIVLLSFVLGLVLSLGIFAGAQMGGGGGSALGVAEGQVGKPFVMGTDGPDTFSCVGLMRYALRTAGVDSDAPWSPEAYLGRYPSVAPGDLQPGDIVIYPGWATMYSGGGMLVNANEMEGVVTHTPMDVAGTPLGIVRPGGGGSQPVANDPAAAVDPAAAAPALEAPALEAPTGAMQYGEAPALEAPTGAMQYGGAPAPAEQFGVAPALEAPAGADPALALDAGLTVDPLAVDAGLTVDPLAVDVGLGVNPAAIF